MTYLFVVILQRGKPSLIAKKCGKLSSKQDQILVKCSLIRSSAFHLEDVTDLILTRSSNTYQNSR